MTLKTKKIIAREGIILIGITILSCVSVFILDSFQSTRADWAKEQCFVRDLIGILIPVYSVYLLFRFIIWVVKTLKEE